MAGQTETKEPSATRTGDHGLHEMFDYFFQLGGGSIKVGFQSDAERDCQQGEDCQPSVEHSSERESVSPSLLQDIEEQSRPEDVQSTSQKCEDDNVADNPKDMAGQTKTKEPSATRTGDHGLHEMFDYFFQLGGGSIKVGFQSDAERDCQQGEDCQPSVEHSSERESVSPSLLQDIEEQSRPEDVQSTSQKCEDDNVADNLNQREFQLSSDSDSDDFLDESETRKVLEMSSPCTKKLKRKPYTDEERVKILKYIVDRDEYSRVKGRDLWIVMAAREVCGTRSWQSMKEHFMKKIVYELDEYKFLTKEQKRKLRVSAFNI